MSAITKSHSLCKSTTYALRSRANVTESDSNRLEWTPVGHIMVTLSDCLTLLLDYLIDQVLSSAVQNL
jgi:hypothetical protein